MKREWQIKVLVLVVVGVVILVAKFLPPAMAYWESSEVYKRYSRVEGVRATYVKDFRVNDTLTVGVTLLEATDSAGWVRLLQRFNASDDMVKTAEYSQDTNKVWLRLSPKGRPEEKIGVGTQGGGSKENDLEYEMVTISFEVRAIGIFHTNSKEELFALYNYNFDYMANKNKNNTILKK